MKNDKKTNDIVSDCVDTTDKGWKFTFPEDKSTKNWCEFSSSVYICHCGICNSNFYSKSKDRICKECFPEHLAKFKKQQMTELKPKFEKVVELYVNAFCDKQQLEFSFWIDDVGGVAFFNEVYILYFDDIRYDVDNDIPKGKIVEYSLLPPESKINYKNFCKLSF